ncbi:MAG TPA: glycosyltransferase family 2 protein [Alphaproteobacteria bacterium]
MPIMSVAILLATYNGAPFLDEQLESLAHQTHSDWNLFVSDDGSTDGTPDIIRNYPALSNHDVTIFKGPQKGFGQNFLSLVYNESISAKYYAYADQDDIWDDNKIERAVAWLETVPHNVPALYCSRTRLIDDDGFLIGMSNHFMKPPCFTNALVQNIAGGNTMVFNHAACTLLRQVKRDLPIHFHDWWTYIAISAAGGMVFFDTEPTMDYRQHAQNLIGSNNSWNARIVRIKRLLSGDMKPWNNEHVAALRTMSHHLTPRNHKVFDHFIKSRETSFPLRLWHLGRSRLHRQTKLGNIGLVIGTLLKKI